MAEKPILFNGDMVKAILNGRKTITRRVIKPQPTNPYWCGIGHRWDDGHGHELKCPYQVGDILWVRETWGKDENGEYVYRANYGTTEDDSFPPSMFKWKPSIHMPREAARIFLRVKTVRVERLQDITEEDAIAEGCGAECDCNGILCETCYNTGWADPPILDFMWIWDSIYAKPRPVKEHGVIVRYESYPWENIQKTRTYKGLPWAVCGNPWIWVYEFKRYEP